MKNIAVTAATLSLYGHTASDFTMSITPSERTLDSHGYQPGLYHLARRE
jgi:hypothetical protein